jgi:tetratricopeptide (TPR) repeat protein
LEYAHEIRDNNSDTSIFWVFAGSKERFERDYQEIAAGLKLPGYSDPEADVLSLVKRELENPDSKKWVMIIDNADDLSLFYDTPPSDLDTDRGNLCLQRGMFNYIPYSQNGSILFTTRSKADALQLTSEGRIIKVTEMSNEDLMFLLRTKFDGEIPEDFQWLDLIEVLERLPLAIVQAASYIRQMCWTVTKYLEYFRHHDSDVQLLLHDFRDKTRDKTVANSVFKTWMITVQQLETQHPLAAEVLWTMAFYNRLNIPRSLLIRSVAARGWGDTSDYHLDKAIGTLVAYSFINIATSKQGESYTMHRLLQVFARYWLKEHRRTAAEWASKALASLRLELPKLEYENWAKYAELLPHLAELIDFRPVSSLPVDDFGVSLIAGAAYLEVRAQYHLASHYANLALETLCENLGHEHPTTADARCRLASIYRDMGQLQEAERFSRSAISIYRKVFGSGNEQSLGALQTLSGVLRQQGKFDEAEILAREFAQAIAIRDGQEALITLEAQIDLAAILGDTGRYEESLQIQKVVADVMRRKFGPEHPKLAYVLHDLAITLNMNGQFEEARVLSEKVFELNSKFYGPVHPRTSNIEYNLGLALDELGEFEEAERHFQHVLDFRKRHTDERSRISTIECIQNLARCLERQRKYESAAGYYQLAVESVTNFGLLVKLADTMSACQDSIERCLKHQEKSDNQDLLDKVNRNRKITSSYPYQREYGGGGNFGESCGG